MRILSAVQHGLGISVAFTMLAGCSSGATPLAPVQSAQQSSGSGPKRPLFGLPTLLVARDNATRRAVSRSWMSPSAKEKTLLYVADQGDSVVYVYNYPADTLLGVLTDILNPSGFCTNGSNVWIVSNAGQEIIKYKVGGEIPIATLNDAGYNPWDCAFDKTTGNIAVSNLEAGGSGGEGNLAVYRPGKADPTYYTTPNMYSYDFLSYDGDGKLLIDGVGVSGQQEIAELPAGGSSMRPITLKQAIGRASGVLWDGKYWAIGDYFAEAIYRFSIKGGHGTEVGTTPVTGVCGVTQFDIYKGQVIVPSACSRSANVVGFYAYPAGGTPTKTLYQPDPVAAIVVSAR